MVNIGRCARSCNTLDDLFRGVCVLNEREDLNLYAFNIITRINESRTLTKDVSCKCECKFDNKNVAQIKSGITVTVSVIVKIQKNIVCAKKGFFGILQHIAAKIVNM